MKFTLMVSTGWGGMGHEIHIMVRWSGVEWGGMECGGS